MPWNFPFWQAMRFALPALTAGNGVFLKHSPNVTGSALAIQQVCEEAGLPAGVFTTIVVEEERVPEVSDRLIADDRIAAVTLTGSNRAGAGSRRGRRPRSQEGRPRARRLGRLRRARRRRHRQAAATAVRARFTNAGQSCVCAKRFIVEEAVAEEFIREVRRRGPRPDGRRPHGGRHRSRPDGARRPARRRPTPGRGLRCRRRDPGDRRQADRGGRLLLRAHRADGHAPRHCGLRRGDLRARRGGQPLPRRGRRRSSSPTPPSSGSG